MMCDQHWFWTDEWQEKEWEVDEHIRKGEIQTFDTIEEFLESLDDKEERESTPVI